MAVNEELLAEAQRAAEQICQAQLAVEEARAGYCRAVRALYLDGASMREIGDRLGISHQRVHQLLDVPGTARWRSARRRGRPGTDGALVCAFCGRPHAKVSKLIAGPGTAICDACVFLAEALLASRGGPAVEHPHVPLAVCPSPGTCGFCGKRSGGPNRRRRGSALALVAMPDGGPSICAECIDLCIEIINEESRD